MSASSRHRILVVDDNEQLHQDFRKILGGDDRAERRALDALEAELFGAELSPSTAEVRYQIDSAFQGAEALQMVSRAEAEGSPYALVFMDVRMPPGWDGIETTQRIWSAHPAIEVVVCTAYSDYEWREIVDKLGTTDQLLFLRKPFDVVSVQQMALAVTRKWELGCLVRRRMEDLGQKVDKRNLQLRRVISKLRTQNQALRQETHRADDASRAKSDFIASVSHEIRTPLNGLLGMIGLLADTHLDDEQRHLMEVARSSGAMLLHLVNDVLDFSKIESRRMELERLELDLSQLLDELTVSVAISAGHKQLELACVADADVPTQVVGDPGRLRQILLNLLSNAIKFTAAGKVVLRVRRERAAPPGEIVLTFEVEDTGVGISEQDRARIFESFTQADSSTTRRFGGTGLGLAISKHLVELMGGEVGVESEVGRGSRFSATIPFAVSPNATAWGARLSSSLPRSALFVGPIGAASALVTEQLGALGVPVTVLPDAGALSRALAAACVRGSTPELVVAEARTWADPALDLSGRLEGLVPRPRGVVLTAQLADVTSSAKARLPDVHLRRPLRPASYLAAFAPAEPNVRPSSAAPIAAHTFEARVLVVEDNVVNQKVAVRMLERLGCEVLVASDGREGVEMLSRGAFDIVFMDCQMPVMDGYAAAREIRRREQAGLHVPIIAMTANARREDLDACTAAGMDACITKPVERSLFVRALETWVGPCAAMEGRARAEEHRT